MKDTGRILLVDDDPQFLLVMQKLLEFEGFEARAAQSAREGVELFGSTDFDAAVIDLYLGGDFGLDLLGDGLEAAAGLAGAATGAGILGGLGGLLGAKPPAATSVPDDDDDDDELGDALADAKAKEAPALTEDPFAWAKSNPGKAVGVATGVVAVVGKVLRIF